MIRRIKGIVAVFLTLLLGVWPGLSEQSADAASGKSSGKVTSGKASSGKASSGKAATRPSKPGTAGGGAGTKSAKATKPAKPGGASGMKRRTDSGAGF